MKTKLFLMLSAMTALATLAACSPKTVNDESSASEGSPTAEMADMSGMGMVSSAKTGAGVGTVTAIDRAAGTVTIKHEAIPAIGWPAMTMAFEAHPASLLTGLKIGDRINFDVSVDGSSAEVTAIQVN